MTLLPDPPLCLITDERSDPVSLAAVVETACAAGCRWVQLRQRRLGGRDLVALARSLRAITTQHGAMLIVNDRVDVAVAADADGVHLPAAGIEAARVRAVLDNHGRPKSLIGRSVHATGEIVALKSQPLDYLQFGPVFATASKAAFGAPQRLEGLASAASATARPVIAVGGIDADNVAAVMAQRAAGVAVIGAVMSAIDSGRAVAELVSAMSSA